MNNVVFESSSKIREIARSTLANNFKTAFSAYLIYSVFSSVVYAVLGVFFSVDYTDAISNILFGANAEVKKMFLEYLQGNRMLVNVGGSVYTVLLGGIFSYGIVSFFLKFVRGEKATLSNCFDGFSRVFALIAVSVVIWVLLALQFFLLIIPSIIAYYRYSLVYYVMVDNPDYSIFKCISESGRLMRGNKWNYFVLQLSFIGWLALGLFAGTLIMFVVPLTLHPLLYTLISAVAAVGLYAALTYMSAAEAIFYELATRKLVVYEPSAYPNYPYMQGGAGYSQGGNGADGYYGGEGSRDEQWGLKDDEGSKGSDE